jgi:hypothetical protein
VPGLAPSVGGGSDYQGLNGWGGIGGSGGSHNVDSVTGNSMNGSGGGLAVPNKWADFANANNNDWNTAQNGAIASAIGSKHTNISTNTTQNVSVVKPMKHNSWNTYTNTWSGNNGWKKTVPQGSHPQGGHVHGSSSVGHPQTHAHGSSSVGYPPSWAQNQVNQQNSNNYSSNNINNAANVHAGTAANVHAQNSNATANNANHNVNNYANTKENLTGSYQGPGRTGLPDPVEPRDFKPRYRKMGGDFIKRTELPAGSGRVKTSFELVRTKTSGFKVLLVPMWTLWTMNDFSKCRENFELEGYY